MYKLQYYYIHSNQSNAKVILIWQEIRNTCFLALSQKYFSQYLIKTLHIGEKLKNNVLKLCNLVLLVISSSSHHFPLVWTEIVPVVVVAAGVLKKKNIFRKKICSFCVVNLIYQSKSRHIVHYYITIILHYYNISTRFSWIERDILILVMYVVWL